MLYRYYYALFTLLLLSGCSQNNYSPNLVATPFISEKNDASVSLNFGGLASTNIDLQAAYNPKKQVTILTNFFRSSQSFNESSSSTNNPVSTKLYLEAGLGGWKHFIDTSFNAGLIFGIGAGRVRNEFSARHISKLHYNKYFIQPTICHRGRVFRFGMGTRFVYLDYRKANIDIAIPVSDLDAVRALERKNPFLMLETGINIGVYFNGVTLTGNLVRSTIFGGAEGNPYNFDLGNTSLGLTFDIHRIFKKRPLKK